MPLIGDVPRQGQCTKDLSTRDTARGSNYLLSLYLQYIYNLPVVDNLSTKDKTSEYILSPMCPLFGGSTGTYTQPVGVNYQKWSYCSNSLLAADSILLANTASLVSPASIEEKKQSMGMWCLLSWSKDAYNFQKSHSAFVVSIIQGLHYSHRIEISQLTHKCIKVNLVLENHQLLSMVCTLYFLTLGSILGGKGCPVIMTALPFMSAKSNPSLTCVSER